MQQRLLLLLTEQQWQQQCPVGCRRSLGSRAGQQLLLLALPRMAALCITAAEELRRRLQLQLSCQMTHLTQLQQQCTWLQDSSSSSSSSSSSRRCQYPSAMGPAAVQDPQAGLRQQGLVGRQQQRQIRRLLQLMCSRTAAAPAPQAAWPSRSRLRRHRLPSCRARTASSSSSSSFSSSSKGRPLQWRGRRSRRPHLPRRLPQELAAAAGPWSLWMAPWECWKGRQQHRRGCSQVWGRHGAVHRCCCRARVSGRRHDSRGAAERRQQRRRGRRRQQQGRVSRGRARWQHPCCSSSTTSTSSRGCWCGAAGGCSGNSSRQRAHLARCESVGGLAPVRTHLQPAAASVPSAIASLGAWGQQQQQQQQQQQGTGTPLAAVQASGKAGSSSGSLHGSGLVAAASAAPSAVAADLISLDSLNLDSQQGQAQAHGVCLQEDQLLRLPVLSSYGAGIATGAMRLSQHNPFAAASAIAAAASSVGSPAR
ncbi:hypothetical protein COO60DRAFT_488371 [Scenedesmus sp. NREL 46B-D3]|nr:hypothetical protein COO60DRAFT_488371 [Scenedesmus sp. NREL 46B-D3]